MRNASSIFPMSLMESLHTGAVYTFHAQTAPFCPCEELQHTAIDDRCMIDDPVIAAVVAVNY